MIIWMEKRRYKNGRDVQFEFEDNERVCTKELFGKHDYGTIISHCSGVSGRDGYYANYKVKFDNGVVKDYKEEKLGREVLK